MAYKFLSPEVRVVEQDFNAIVTPQDVAVGAFVGTFTWGPVEEVRVVTTESHMVQQFWKPNKKNYIDFTTAAQFLGYSNHLKIVRVISDHCRNAASGGDGSGLLLDAVVVNGEVSSVTINNGGSDYVPGDIVFLDGGLENAKIMVTEVGNNGEVINIDLLTNGDGYPGDITAGSTTILNNLVVKNEDHFESQTHMPQFVAKYPGDMGNSIGVGIVNAANFQMWKFKERFITEPRSQYYNWSTKDNKTNTFVATLKDSNNNPIPFPHVNSPVGNDFVVEGAILEQGVNPGQYQVSYNSSTGETTFTINTVTDNFTGNGSDWKFSLSFNDWKYEHIGFVTTIDGNEVPSWYGDADEEVPVGYATIRNGELIIGTNRATFDGKIGVLTYKIIGVTGITDARVWVDGVEKTVVSSAPSNANEVQVADDGQGNTKIVFHASGAPGVGNDNIVVRWGFPANNAAIQVTYGYPIKGIDMVRAFWDQDFVHVIVYDDDGKWSGVKDYVLEAFTNLSLDPDAKDDSGLSNYFRKVLNERSLYVWTAPHDISTDLPVVYGDHILTGGVDGVPTYIRDADYMNGWQIFRNRDKYNVTHLITGDRSVAVKKYVIEQVAEYRKDAIAWVSPQKESVVNNPFQALTKVLEDRNMLNASSYAAMDCNWKLVYSQHLDEKVWVPCCADSAGIYSRATNNFYPWIPGAGYNRGHLINVLRLAWSPNKAERDELYVSPRNVNPIFHDIYDGTILFGNKTLYGRDSAFDRINTRLLFIVLEKSIERAAKYFLFELNTPFTRTQFRNMITPFLRDVKALDGVEDYRVVVDERNNPPYVRARHELIADILVKPTYSIEYITLRFSAVGPNLSFDYVIGELTS